MSQHKPLQTFISYSRVNQQFAIRLASELKSSGFCVWMDQFDIPTGARWDDEIEKALKQSQIFLFIMTPDSTASENAKDEMSYAIDHGKRILPVLLEKCEVPLRLRRMQYVDFTRMSFDQGIKRAKELLSEMVEEIEGPKPETTKQSSGSRIEKQAIAGLNEPQTTPTKRRIAPSTVPTRSGSSGRHILKRVVAGGGILVMGILIITALTFKLPSFAFLGAPSPTATISPTKPLIVTSSPIPTSIPIIQTPEVLRTFAEDFNSDSQWKKDWALQLRHGNTNKLDSLKYPIANGEMEIQILHEFVWGYFLYEPVIQYNNVELEAVVKDLNSVDTFGLVCQFSNQGWYEFDINGGGMFYVRYVDNMESNQDAAEFIINYGSIPGFKDSFVTSRENTIRALCNGNHLSLFVNDVQLINDIPSKFNVEQGQIGFSVRSYEKYPVRFVVQSLKVREPEN